MKVRAFTLMELMIVIVIIGILATIGVAYFDPMRENALDNEAQSNLRLIIAAERTARMETGAYLASNDMDVINTSLRLLLPRQANRSWNYQTTVIAASGEACAQATRNGAGARTWCFRIGRDDPLRGGTCAANCP